MNQQLIEHYNRELQYLRGMGAEFAREYPRVAGRLGLDAFECADPFVERLLEGFAFLTARINLKIESEFPRFSEQLLGLVCPHYLGPTPSMAVAEFSPDERQAGLAQGFVIPRGTSLRAAALHTDVRCDYRTAQDVTLWPIEIAAIEMTRDLPKVLGPTTRPARAGMRLRLRTTNGLPLQAMPLDALTLFFRGGDALPWRVFELLVAGAAGLAWRPAGTDTWSSTEGATLRPSGLNDAEALLPVGPRAYQGHRLLHEYLAFPERLRFVRLDGLGDAVRACSATELEVLVLLDRADPAVEGPISPSRVSLFASPIVNLFPRRADRVALADADFEHHVVVDRAHPSDFEVHSVSRITGLGPHGEALSEFSAFYRNREGADAAAPPAFFTVQRHERLPSSSASTSFASTYRGSEVYVSLIDGAHGPFRDGLHHLSTQVLCTNRDLPLRLAIGSRSSDFEMEAGGPVKAVRCIAGPSAPRAAMAGGETTWRLIGQLSLNYLTLTDSSPSDGAAALRELLALYVDANEASSHRQVGAVRSVGSRPIVRRLPFDGPPSFGRGIELTLDFDEVGLEGTSAFALSLVLAQLFAASVSINSFVETVARTQQRGEIARWPSNPGRRPMI